MAVFSSLILGIGGYHLSLFLPFSSIVFVALAAAAMVIFWNLRAGDSWSSAWPAKLPVVLLLIAAGYAYAFFLTGPADPLEGLYGDRITVTGVPSSEAALISEEEEIYSQMVRAESAIDSRQRSIGLSSIRIVGRATLPAGSRYRIEIAIPREPTVNPGHGYRQAWGYSLGATDLGEVSQGIFGDARTRLNHLFRQGFAERTGPFLMSQITGDRSALSREVREAFNATGLAHVLSISGTHFGLLFIILFKAIRLIIRCMPLSLLARLTNHVTPSQIAAIICLPLMSCYLGISDMSTPSVRSFLMISLFLVGLLINRRGMWLNTLLIAALVILLIDPGALRDLSFQLSFIAVLCIGLVSEYLRGIPGKTGTEGEAPGPGIRLARFTAQSVLISLAATIGTAPLVAYYFHYFSFISPLTNLFITPFIGFVILPVSLISSFVFLLTGHFPLQSFVEESASGVLTVILALSRVPMIDIGVPSFPPFLLLAFYSALACVVGLVVSSAPARRLHEQEQLAGRDPVCRGSLGAAGNAFRTQRVLISLCLTAGIVPYLLYALVKAYEAPVIRATFLDAGQADAAVVELPDGKVLVVDTGRNGFQVAQFLRYRGIRRIDAVILSHADIDHAGGTRFLLDSYAVSELWDNGRMVYAFPIQGVSRRHLVRGDVLEGNGYRIVCLHPYEGYYGDGRREGSFNDESLVLRVEGLHNTFLFTGDIERDAQENLVHLGRHLRSTVLKVPHHGGRTALIPEFLTSVAPEIAVISVGRGNRYGMPHQDILGMLAGSDVYRTDRDGAVGIREQRGGSPLVRTAREFVFETGDSPGREWRNISRLFRSW